METKNKLTEHTANVAMSHAPTIKVGANFAKPIPRLIAQKKKSFLQRLMKS